MISIANINTMLVPVATIETKKHVLKRIKQGIWLYLWLLLFEGALRKWFLPELSDLLLIIRDPIAIWLLIEAYRNHVFKFNSYIIGAAIIAWVSLITTIVFGHGNLVVALYGARIMVIQFPFLFMIGLALKYEDVVIIGRALLWLTPFMTLLMAVQFYSPQDAWINRGLGGDATGAGFSGAMGFYRPPGTFSFITGLAAYYGLVAAYVIFFWIENSIKIKRWLLLIATVSLLIAIPLSISRTLFFQVTLSLSFAIIASARKPKYLFRIILTLSGGIITLNVLANFEFFQTVTDVFLSRFESASDVEGGLKGTLGNRVLGGMLHAITESDNQATFWGKGLGMGTNAGAKLMTGNSIFLISEGEWGRLIGEMGLLLGLIFIWLRIHLIYKISYVAYKALLLGNFLPWFLLSFAFTNIIQGQWSQPTALGFAVFSGGILIASLKK